MLSRALGRSDFIAFLGYGRGVIFCLTYQDCLDIIAHMRTKTPLQEKTPFAIDGKPMEGLLTAQAGLACFSRAFRSLGAPKLCDDHVRIKERSRGFTVGQQVESLVLLHTAGGDCMQDIEQLRKDSGVTKLLGYAAPGERCVADFLESFHDPEKVAQARAQAQRQEHLSFIPEETAALSGLGQAARGIVRAIAGRSRKPETRATVDQDATIIESHKREARWTYEGTRGYQPMVAVWAETGLIVADEFRDGNVPAMSSPLTCAQAAFAALPESVTQYYFRGDSACHESGLVNWLRDADREWGPKGLIGFAVSARMSEELGKALKAHPEAQWTTFGKDADGTLRQWAEADFVPGEKVEKKDIEPLRYVGLRLLKPQGELFADGNDKHYHAIVTNRWDEDGGELLTWHREKAGMIEHVHDEVKNGLGGGQLPSAKFGANAAWFRIACIAYNILVAVRQAWPDETLHNAKAKRVRFILVNVTGRFSRDRRKITLHLSATVEWIKRLVKLFARFPLATQPTG